MTNLKHYKTRGIFTAVVLFLYFLYTLTSTNKHHWLGSNFEWNYFVFVFGTCLITGFFDIIILLFRRRLTWQKCVFNIIIIGVLLFAFYLYDDYTNGKFF